MQEETLPAEGTTDQVIAPSVLKHAPKPGARQRLFSPARKRDVSGTSARALDQLAACWFRC